MRVTWHQVACYRADTTHLARRLAPGELAAAAASGLQDSAPRSALLSLAARVEDVGPLSWEDPSLVQIWFRGGADYVVPRADVGLFTLGALPRDPAKAAALEACAERFLEVMDGRAHNPKHLAPLVEPDQPFLIRGLCVTGRFRIRWDASTIQVMPAERPDIDPEDARRGLARRFLHCYGPAKPDQFAKWAKLTRGDANTTWAALTAEVETVEVGSEKRALLAADVVALEQAALSPGVRLLPVGDPFLYLDRDHLTPEERRPLPEPGPDIPQRLLNSLAGRLMIDGRLVGQWGRVQADFTIFPWIALTPAHAERVETEVAALEGPLGKPPRLRWLP